MKTENKLMSGVKVYRENEAGTRHQELAEITTEITTETDEIFHHVFKLPFTTGIYLEIDIHEVTPTEYSMFLEGVIERMEDQIVDMKDAAERRD